MALHLTYTTPQGEFQRRILEISQPMDAAVKEAMREARSIILDRGRANIASAGFSKRWEDGFRVAVDTKSEEFSASLRTFHRIGFAGIFETGGTIFGKPLLWIPIQANLPSRGRMRWTPRTFVRLVGPLASVRKARRPILVGKPPGMSRAVPVFFGVRSVDIRKRFDITGVVAEVVDDFARLYEKHMKDV